MSEVSQNDALSYTDVDFFSSSTYLTLKDCQTLNLLDFWQLRI